LLFVCVFAVVLFFSLCFNSFLLSVQSLNFLLIVLGLQKRTPNSSSRSIGSDDEGGGHCAANPNHPNTLLGNIRLKSESLLQRFETKIMHPLFGGPVRQPKENFVFVSLLLFIFVVVGLFLGGQFSYFRR
jgi:hypothetical protein